MDVNLRMDVNLNPSLQQPQDPKLAGDAAAQAEAISQVAPLLGEAGNVRISLQVYGVDTNGRAIGSVSAPELDEADVALAALADLEATLAYLKMEVDEKQVEAQAKRLDSLKGQLKAAHDYQMGKVNESIEKAREQEKAAKAQRALSWIGAIISVVAAVVLTLTTGGLAAGFAIAGAVLAVSSAFMNQFGGDRALLKAMSESIREDFGCNKRTADAVAQGIYGTVQLVLGLACSFGGLAAGGSAAAQAAANVARTGVSLSHAAKIGQTVCNVTMFVANATTSAASTALGYQASIKQAETTEAQAILNKLQKFLEESQDDMQEILEQIMNTGVAVLELLESKTDTLNKITAEIGSQNA